jgi:AraC-like DNA-binding protein
MSSIKKVEELCIRSVPLVKIYSISKSIYPMHNRGRRHHGLLFPLAGTEIYRFRDGVISAPPGSVLFIPDGEDYRIELEGEESVVICIDLELVGTAELRPVAFPAEKVSGLRPLFHEAVIEWNRGNPWRDASVKSTVYRIFAALISAEAQSPRTSRLAPALNHLHTHYTERDFSIEILAEIAGMSRRYFEKLFFAEHGMTPRDYVIGLRMDLARELLLNEKLSVTDVSTELGYADVYHFSKLFKQKTGYSPAEYKRSTIDRSKGNKIY